MKMKKTKAVFLTALLGAALVLPACKKKGETAVAAPDPAAYPTSPAAPAGARVERITVAKSVNSDDSPGEADAFFGKRDTVYISMWTANAPVGTEITARWTGPDGTQIAEDKVVTDKAGDGYTSFHAANTKGWAPGNYRVEILLNGQPAGSASFTVS